MGRARGQQDAISATNFTAVFGGRRGRNPGEKEPDERDRVSPELLSAQRTEQLLAQLKTSDVASTLRWQDLTDAIAHINTFSFPQSPHFTEGLSEDEQHLLTSVAAGLQDHVHYHNRVSHIYDVQTFCEASLADDDTIAHINELGQERVRSRIAQHLRDTPEQPLTLVELVDRTLLDYRNNVARVLADKLVQARDNPAPGQGRPKPLHSVFGPEGYRQLQRELGSRWSRPDLEAAMTVEMWERALRQRATGIGLPSFAAMLQDELRSAL